jgi:hypothetical protein
VSQIEPRESSIPGVPENVEPPRPRVMTTYRWIVRVQGIRAPYAREVTTDGPQPHEAAKAALDMIADDDENDMWQADTLRIEVERVR